VSKIYVLLIYIFCFCPNTDKHLAVLRQHTSDTQSMHIFGFGLNGDV
jgi:hypothetical protein